MQNESVSTPTARVEYIKFKMSPEEEPHFLEGYRSAKSKLEECETCSRYELRRAERKGQLMLRIEWTAEMASWPHNEVSAPARRFLMSLKGALKSVTEFGAYELIDASAPQYGL
jgi:hypothetical protein